MGGVVTDEWGMESVVVDDDGSECVWIDDDHDGDDAVVDDEGRGVSHDEGLGIDDKGVGNDDGGADVK